MSKKLIIVESPSKANTIKKFLGREYNAIASMGHIRDLPTSKMGIDIENGFKPTYITPKKNAKYIKQLKTAVRNADEIFLATDQDREGEAIAWHLCTALGLDINDTKRIVFHEITKTAINNAIENPELVDQKLVDAQQARRILDRLVGYELSPLLWKKIKPSLSAGRVQSVAVRLIVEREDEISKFKSKESYKVVAYFKIKKDSKDYEFTADLLKNLKSKDGALEFLNECKTGKFSVANIEKKPGKKSPKPPFTTSTLQQEANNKMGFSVSRTMILAQHLYEAGAITYMRTDSLNLSKLAIGKAIGVITNKFGKEYSKPRNFKTKSKGAQEAHEAIRPTNLEKEFVGKDSSEKKLYNMIWKRTIASQMSSAKVERTKITIDISTSKKQLIGKGEVLIFDGFLKVYFDGSNSQKFNQNILPPIKIGDVLELLKLEATQKFSNPPARFSEATLVKVLEELGIGRPSTYAPTINTIQKRGYVVKEDRDGKKRKYDYLLLENGKIEESIESENTGFQKKKLFPTDIGIVVNEFLIKYFKDVLSYNFTAHIEDDFDKIADGKMKWQKMIEEFYKPFHSEVEVVSKEAERHKGERLLGKDPKSGKNIYARIARYGSVVQRGEVEDDKKPDFAKIKKNQSLTSITLEDALELLKFPKLIGKYKEKEMTIGLGRYGPYIRYNSQFYSIKKPDLPDTIDSKRAIEIIKESIIEKQKNILKEYENGEIIVQKGRYGPYIKFKSKNYKIPKIIDAENITLEECKDIIEKKGKGGNLIKEFKAEDMVINDGKYGAYIKHKKKNYTIPKNIDPTKITLEQCKEVIKNKAKSKKVKKRKK
ncbi:MAG: type I DNA topoisomerase [Candidatus Marinimicrobia bacterium]|nr:type I DNA topoisomerase [Candidatus Neomarinimicrobiota bacterium]